MTDKALRDALAEALYDLDQGNDYPEREDAERMAAHLVAHPAVLAALDRSDPPEYRRELWDRLTGGEKLAYGMGWRDAERDSAEIANRDRSDPAAGLREALHRGVDEPFRAGPLDVNVLRSRIHAAIEAALAATLAASPTEAERVARDISRHIPASPTATGEDGL